MLVGFFFYGHALAGVRVQRVQKVQKVQRVVVGGYAANINKTFTIGLCPVENRQTALAGVGNAPLFPYGDFPRRGKYFSL